MHPVIEEHPAWREYAQHVEQIREAEATIKAELVALDVEHDAALQLWSEEAATAREALRPEPARPEPPDTTAQREALHGLALKRRELDDERLDVLAELRPVVEEAYDLARPELARRTSRKVKALDREHGEFEQWRRALHSVRDAVERHDPNRRMTNGPSTRMATALALVDLLVLADDPDSDLCAPTPLARPEGSVRVGDEPEVEVLQVRRDRSTSWGGLRAGGFGG